MNDLQTIRGACNRNLYVGARVVFTSGSRLFQAIINKVNPHKCGLTKTNSNWEPLDNYSYNIDNSKIFKTNE